MDMTPGVIRASWLSAMAQKNGTRAKNPLKLESPSTGKRKPVWRSRRMAV